MKTKNIDLKPKIQPKEKFYLQTGCTVLEKIDGLKIKKEPKTELIDAKVKFEVKEDILKIAGVNILLWLTKFVGLVKV